MSAAQARPHVGKAQEYLAASTNELGEGRRIAATSLAIHAAINAADAVTGVRIGRRSTSEGHDEVAKLLGEAGKDGAEVARNLARLPLKTKAEYEPGDIPQSAAKGAVERAGRCVAVAIRLTAER